MISKRLRLLRNEKKLTQEEISNFLSITRQAYSKWESGERKPDIESLVMLADFYNVSLDFLACRTDIRYNFKQDKELENYINYCITGYYRYLKKD